MEIQELCVATTFKLNAQRLKPYNGVRFPKVKVSLMLSDVKETLHVRQLMSYLFSLPSIFSKNNVCVVWSTSRLHEAQQLKKHDTSQCVVHMFEIQTFISIKPCCAMYMKFYVMHTPTSCILHFRKITMHNTKPLLIFFQNPYLLPKKLNIYS